MEPRPPAPPSRLPLAVLALALAAGTAVAEGPASYRNPSALDTTTWLPERQPDHRIRYADESPTHYGDLRLPEATPPAAGFPVVVFIHGGAWHADWTNQYSSAFVEALTASGVATWDIEYRRLGNRGGGFPGTFADVGLATDFVRELAQEHPLDLDRVVVVGHSSGGHLALWVAGRANLPADSVLAVDDPLPLAGVISLAGVNDLEGALEQGGRTDVLEIVGLEGRGAAEDARFGETSPMRLLPFGVPQVLIVGTGDADWRIATTEAYAAAASEAGDAVELVIPEGANHFDVVDPAGPILALTVSAIETLVGDRR